MLVYVGTQLCHAQLEPVPLTKLRGWMFPAGNRLSLISSPSMFTPLAEVNSEIESTLRVGFDIVAVFIVGLVSVLFVSVCDPVSVTTLDGKVGEPPRVYVPATVPLRVGLDTVGLVSVLFVSVWLSVVETGLPPEKPSIELIVASPVKLSEASQIGSLSVARSTEATVGKPSIVASAIVTTPYCRGFRIVYSCTK